MIVYIIPGKTKTIQKAVDYVVDEKKMAKNFDEFRMEYEASPELQENMTLEDFHISNVDNINRALNYIANEDKIGGYVSGYLCDPQFCEQEFRETKMKNLNRVGKHLKDDIGNYFYHIIQSFPEGLDISDEEVHQCGVELVKRLGLYQAVVASHIHPVIDEEGEAHGRCKHNHIIMNSHIYHEFVDKDNPHNMKYNDCKESYAQLQLINDQIAIEHGLPVIDKPDMGKVYSWFESKETNAGKSWKARVKIDISNAMRGSENLDDYIDAIQSAGYKIRFGKSKSHGDYIAYTCPEEEHVVRDYILGKGYSLPELQSFWEIKRAINEDILENQGNSENKIEKLLESTHEPLFIKFKNNMSERRKEKLREINMNTRSSYTNRLPLTSSRPYTGAELTYFDAEKTYKIVNNKNQTITDVSGQEILEYYYHIQERLEQEKKEEEQRRKEEQYKAYTDSRFYNRATEKPYTVSMYDKWGRKRTLIELIVMLAAVVIEKEYGKWNPPQSSELDKQEYKNNPIYATKDWKIQNMVDTVRIAREENIQNLDDLKEKIDLAGKDLSKCRAEIRRLTESKNRMTVISEAFEEYRELKDLCEEIYAMPDSAQRLKLQSEYTQEIEIYKAKKAVLYRYNVISPEEIQDFLERFEEIKSNLERAAKQEEKLSDHSRRLYKLKYNIQLAQNRKYCYGPEFKEPEDNLEQNIQPMENSTKQPKMNPEYER